MHVPASWVSWQTHAGMIAGRTERDTLMFRGPGSRTSGGQESLHLEND